jgi:hypothetical protein
MKVFDREVNLFDIGVKVRDVILSEARDLQCLRTRGTSRSRVGERGDPSLRSG